MLQYTMWYSINICNITQFCFLSTSSNGAAFCKSGMLLGREKQIYLCSETLLPWLICPSIVCNIAWDMYTFCFHFFTFVINVSYLLTSVFVICSIHHHHQHYSWSTERSTQALFALQGDVLVRNTDSLSDSVATISYWSCSRNFS